MKFNDILNQNIEILKTKLVNSLKISKLDDINLCKTLLYNELHKNYSFNKQKFLTNNSESNSKLINTINSQVFNSVKNILNEKLTDKFKTITSAPNSSSLGFSYINNNNNNKSLIYSTNEMTRDKTVDQSKIIEQFIDKRKLEDKDIFNTIQNPIKINPDLDKSFSTKSDIGKIEPLKTSIKNKNSKSKKPIDKTLLNMNTKTQLNTPNSSQLNDNENTELQNNLNIMQQKYNELKNEYDTIITGNMIQNKKKRSTTLISPYIFAELNEIDMEEYLKDLNLEHVLNTISNNNNNKLLVIDSTKYCNTYNNNNYIIDISKMNYKNMSRIEILSFEIQKNITISEKLFNNLIKITINDNQYNIKFEDNIYSIEEIINFLNTELDKKINIGIINHKLTFDSDTNFTLEFSNVLSKILGFTNNIYSNTTHYEAENVCVFNTDLYLFINNYQPKKINTYDNIILINEPELKELNIKIGFSLNNLDLINGFYPHKLSLKFS